MTCFLKVQACLVSSLKNKATTEACWVPFQLPCFAAQNLDAFQHACSVTRFRLGQAECPIQLVHFSAREHLASLARDGLRGAANSSLFGLPRKEHGLRVCDMFSALSTALLRTTALSYKDASASTVQPRPLGSKYISRPAQDLFFETKHTDCAGQGGQGSLGWAGHKAKALP